MSIKGVIKMKRFIVGFVVGLILGGSTAYAAGVFGSGYLFGLTVTKDGDDICDSPYVWARTHEIECD
jgi:hypothetical protein